MNCPTVLKSAPQRLLDRQFDFTFAGASYDPEERLTTSYLFELISLLQPFRPELRPEWAERALSWAAGALDKRVVIDSLRVFAVVNKSVEVGTLVKVERMLLGAARTRDYAVADSVLDVFAKVSVDLVLGF
jgi:hypothetical protein